MSVSTSTVYDDLGLRPGALPAMLMGGAIRGLTSRCAPAWAMKRLEISPSFNLDEAVGRLCQFK